MNILLAFIILLVYTLYVIRLGGSIPPSLSESIFDVPYEKRWTWTATMFAVCVLCMPTIIENTSTNTQFLAFFAVAAIAFVGAAPLCKYKEDTLQFNVHEKAALVAGVLSQVVVFLNRPMLLALWVIYATFFKKMTKTKLFWAEVVCFISTFLYCLCNLEIFHKIDSYLKALTIYFD